MVRRITRGLYRVEETGDFVLDSSFTVTRVTLRSTPRVDGVTSPPSLVPDVGPQLLPSRVGPEDPVHSVKGNSSRKGIVIIRLSP